MVHSALPAANSAPAPHGCLMAMDEGVVLSRQPQFVNNNSYAEQTNKVHRGLRGFVTLLTQQLQKIWIVDPRVLLT